MPIFVDAKSDYLDRRSVTNPTNPYSTKALKLIRDNPTSIILDFGAGNPRQEELYKHVVRMEFVHYRSTDIVSTYRNIPFRDESFDFIISESVFEHVKDPWHYAEELYRVLRIRGIVLVDTAFLQPVHGDPHHYFNMTLQGLKEVFRMFHIVDSGVEPYQSPGFTMNILRDTMVGLISDEVIRQSLKNIIGQIDFTTYDQYIPTDVKHVMSAGVYAILEKR